MSETELLIQLLSYKRGGRLCEIHPIDRMEWRSWAASVYAQAVRESQTSKAPLPTLVAAWMAMRAKRHGWEDLFCSWADRAHKHGSPDKETFSTNQFYELDKRLLAEERCNQAFRSFKDSYEETMGYPVSASPLSKGEVYRDEDIHRD